MRKGRVWGLVLFSLLLFALDATTKYFTFAHFSGSGYGSFSYPYGGIGVFQDFLGIDFSINCVLNKGGAWGVFSSFPKVLLGVRIGIILALAVYTLFINPLKKRTFPFLLIIIGALANIIDVFIYGAVVDMFHFVFWGYSYPVFNVADMLIFFGVAILIMQIISEKLKKDPINATESP